MLTIPLRTVGWIVLKAREFDGKDIDTAEADADGEDPMGVLEDRPDDPSEDEVAGWIEDLNEDEQAELVALFWLGRDDGGAEEWPALLAEARARRAGSTAKYLLGSPLLSDYLEAGLETLGINVNALESSL